MVKRWFVISSVTLIPEIHTSVVSRRLYRPGGEYNRCLGPDAKFIMLGDKARYRWNSALSIPAFRMRSHVLPWGLGSERSWLCSLTLSADRRSGAKQLKDHCWKAVSSRSFDIPDGHHIRSGRTTDCSQKNRSCGAWCAKEKGSFQVRIRTTTTWVRAIQSFPPKCSLRSKKVYITELMLQMG